MLAFALDSAKFVSSCLTSDCRFCFSTSAFCNEDLTDCREFTSRFKACSWNKHYFKEENIIICMLILRRFNFFLKIAGTDN